MVVGVFLGGGGVIASMWNWVVAFGTPESNIQGGILVEFGNAQNFALGPKCCGENLEQNFRSCSLDTNVYALSVGPNFNIVKDRSSSSAKAVRADGRASLIRTERLDSGMDQELRRAIGRLSEE